MLDAIKLINKLFIQYQFLLKIELAYSTSKCIQILQELEFLTNVFYQFYCFSLVNPGKVNSTLLIRETTHHGTGNSIFTV